MTEFSHVLGSLEPWIYQYGVLAIFLISTFELLGAPLPAELLLIVAAILADRGEISILDLFLSGWAGAVVGDNTGYMIGKRFGRRLLLRYGAKVGADREARSKS